MSAAALEQALTAMGVVCAVTAEGALAVIRAAPGNHALEDEASRREAVRLASVHGFRNIALEVAD